MGVFDTLTITCPKCGAEHQHQSKSGPCELNSWTLETLPGELFFAFSWIDQACQCGRRLRLTRMPVKWRIGIADDDEEQGQQGGRK